MPFQIVKIKDTKLKIAELVKQWRKSQSLSQGQLAEVLDLSRVTIQNLESGKNVTVDTLLKIFQHFDALGRFHQFIKDELDNSSHESLY